MAAAHHSRAPSGVPLREFYRIKAEQVAASPAGSGGYAEQRQHRREDEQPGAAPPPRSQSSLARLLARISPRKTGNGNSQRLAAAATAQHRSKEAARGSEQAPAADSGAVADIPAFRPSSPPQNLHQYISGPTDEASSPGKAQLQSVRALARRQQQQQQQPPQARKELRHATPPAAQAAAAQPSQATPGWSEATSTGRVVDDQIMFSIANLLMPTPGTEAGHGSRGASSRGGQQGRQQLHGLQGGASGGGLGLPAGQLGGSSQQQEQRRMQVQARQGSAPAACPALPARQSVDGAEQRDQGQGQQQHSGLPVDKPSGSGLHEPQRPHSSGHPFSSGSSGHGGPGKLRTAPGARAPSVSPVRELPAPPPPPAAPQTALGDSVALEAQSFKSPVFMSRRRRTIYCELDDPGRAIVFPHKAPRRVGRVQRVLASMFGCFVPSPHERSPAPSLHFTPSGRRTSSSQAPSPSLGATLAFGMDPLRQSLAELVLSDPELRDQLYPTLAAAAGSARAASTDGAVHVGSSPAFVDLLGLQHGQEEEQANMASPVLPSRPVSGGSTPAGLAVGSQDWDEEDWDEEGGEESPGQLLAKRNLMDVLRSREVDTLQGQQAPPPQQQQPVAGAILPQVAQKQQQLNRPRSAHHLQPWHRERLAAQAAAAAGAPPAAAQTKATHVTLEQLLAAPGAGASKPRNQSARQLRAVDGGSGKQHNTLKKRGREALGVSRAPSDDTPAFTPKRRDLSKPSYRSEALHKLLSPFMGPEAVAAAALLAGGSGAAGIGRQAGVDNSTFAARLGGGFAAAQRPGTAAAQRPGTAKGLRQSSSAPVSPLRGVGAPQAKGGSAPSSPFTRMTRAAALQAASAQRKRQEQEAQLQALLAKSPQRLLRKAAAAGLPLGKAADLVSPGKSARPYYQRSPVLGSQRATQRGPVAAAHGVAGTPGGRRFDPFAAGEAGVEPYSARLYTAEKPRQRPGSGTAAAQQVQQPGGTVDIAQLAADGAAYREMLQRMVQGLAVEPTQLAPYKEATPPLVPADLLAGAAPTGQGQAQQQLQQRACQAVRVSRGSTAEYCLQQGAPHGTAEEPPGKLNGRAEQVPLTPHHNVLYGKDTTPTKSSPLAQQRMVSMSAAAMAAEQQVEQQQQAQVEEGSGSRQVTASSAHATSSASASISFGSGGCMTSTRAVVCETSGDSELQGGEQQQQRRAAGAGVVQPGGGAREGQQLRLARLARLLEDGEARGEPCTLAQLQAAGFSTHDLYSLKQWLARQQ